MAKRSGLGQRLLVGGYDLSGDALALNNVHSGIALLDYTGIDKSAHERIPGLKDGGLGATTAFNTAAGKAFPVLKTLPRTDVHCAFLMSTTLGDDAFCLVAKQINYDPTRGADGMFTFNTEAQANSYGGEWARTVTAGLRTDTTATNGAGVSMAEGVNTGSAAFGLQAYIQVTAFTGTNCTIKLQESSDDGGSDAYADVTGGGFTQVTAAPASQRIATAAGQTVEKYIRAVTSGTFTSITFAVAVIRNEVAVSF